jgi:FkbM family methyltransferase
LVGAQVVNLTRFRESQCLENCFFFGKNLLVEALEGSLGAVSMNFVFRDNSTDSDIYHDVVINNGYRLPKEFSSCDVAIDIGAHIGSFSYAVLSRGIGKVYAFEADPGNSSQIAMNLSSFLQEGRLILSNKAVFRSDRKDQAVFLGGYSKEGGVSNTGGQGVIFAKEGHAVEAVGLDDIITDVLQQIPQVQKISLLKLDCEGSEWPILLTSRLLSSVENICGEFHELGGRYNQEIPPFEINGLKSYTANHLPSLLRPFGFRVTWHRTRNKQRKGTSCGLFFATKASPISRTYWRHLLRLQLMLKGKLLFDDARYNLQTQFGKREG